MFYYLSSWKEDVIDRVEKGEERIIGTQGNFRNGCWKDVESGKSVLMYIKGVRSSNITGRNYVW